MPEFGGSPRPDRVRELCRRLKPLFGGQMDRIFSAYSFEDSDGKKQIEAYLEAMAARHLPSGLDSAIGDLVPPKPEQSAGEYTLGTVMYAGKRVGSFGLRESEWIQHAAIFGRSGAGKSTTGFQIFRQLLIHKKPVLVFDWKRNYRDLLTLPEFHDVEVYTVGRDIVPFTFNPLIPPPGTQPKTWLKQLNEVIAHAYALGNGVLFLLQESLDAIYTEWGVYSGKVKQWPTFRDVLAKARERNARGRESAWLSSTLRALSMLCFGGMDDLLNSATSQTETVEYLLTRPVILELEALSQSDKTFLTSSLLLYIHHFRMAEGFRESFKHAILIEEAHHLLTNERSSLIGGSSVMETVFREIREFGESIIILDQHPSQISITALGNTYCTICMNLKTQKDVNCMGQVMLLQPDEKDILGGLDVGQAVVKLQGGRAPRPFVISVPEFGIKKGSVTDRALELHMAGRTAAPAGHVVSVSASSQVALSAETDHALSARDARIWAFLHDIQVYPEGGVAERYKRQRISVRQGQKLKGQLLAEGLIEERDERTQTGRVMTVRLTDKGAGTLTDTPRGTQVA